MGLRYSFELVTRADAIDALLRALAAHLAEPDAARVLAALPWRPAIERELVWGSGRPCRDRQGICGLALRDVERTNDWCVGLAFPPDPELERYATAYGARRRGSDVVVGCVWTSLHVGDEDALLQATAATSDMSRLFASSRSVHETWVAIAREANASLVLLDTEDLYERTCLWPHTRAVPYVGIDGFCSGDLTSVRTDDYCFELLRSARVVE